MPKHRPLPSCTGCSVPTRGMVGTVPLCERCQVHAALAQQLICDGLPLVTGEDTMTDHAQTEESLRRLNHIQDTLRGIVRHLDGLPDGTVAAEIALQVGMMQSTVSRHRLRLVGQLRTTPKG